MAMVGLIEGPKYQLSWSEVPMLLTLMLVHEFECHIKVGQVVCDCKQMNQGDGHGQKHRA